MENIYKEISIVCEGDIRYRFAGATVRSWDLYYNNGDTIRIDFKDHSFVEINKNHVLIIEFCSYEYWEGMDDTKKG